MRVVLESRWGDRDTFYVHDMTCPELVDELGRPVLDLTPFGRILPSVRSQDEPSFKPYLDAFMVRPSPGLPDAWLRYPGSKLWDITFQEFLMVFYLLTGKLLVSVDK